MACHSHFFFSRFLIEQLVASFTGLRLGLLNFSFIFYIAALYQESIKISLHCHTKKELKCFTFRHFGLIIDYSYNSLILRKCSTWYQ